MEERASSRGRLITLEGPDGAGKSSQALLLGDALRARGHLLTVVREPGGTALGEQIRALLLASDADHEPVADALLFNAARAQLCLEVIEPALARAEIVVCDRFTDSTLAYQGYGSGLDLAWLEKLNAWSTGSLEPDLTLLFDLPPEEGLQRRRRGPVDQQTRFERRRRDDADFHRRVRDGYLALARRGPGRWRVVDATQPAPIVAAEVLRIVAEFLEAAALPAGDSNPGRATGNPNDAVVRISR